VACDKTSQAAIIDPSWAGHAIFATAEDMGWTITHILLTHAHFDHVGGLADLKEQVDVPIYIHPDAVPMLENAASNAARWGLTLPKPPAPEELLSVGQEIQVGNVTFHVLYTPGHAPGHVSFHVPQENVLFSGDVLFQGSIGRTDLPGADRQTLMQTIREKVMTLPDDTQVLSGHGNPTTVGQERRHNPFLQGA
jgi:glyoxylase-like metal-dependent hydrolase (beta-lactamase superfamily II)